MKDYNSKLIYIFFTALTVSHIACKSSDETVREDKTDESYVFDQVPPEDYYTFEAPPEKSNVVFVVQIGAFSTIDRAKKFADKSRLLLQKDIKVSFNERNDLYVVQIHPPFKKKSYAEKYRDELWKIDEYNDAWISEVEKEK